MFDLWPGARGHGLLSPEGQVYLDSLEEDGLVLLVGETVYDQAFPCDGAVELTVGQVAGLTDMTTVCKRWLERRPEVAWKTLHDRVEAITGKRLAATW